MGSLENGVEKLTLHGREDKEQEREQEEEEPILKEQNQRFCMFPIRYKQLWEMYKKAEASFWTGTFLTVFYFLRSFSEIFSFSFLSVCVWKWVCVFYFFLFNFC